MPYPKGCAPSQRFRFEQYESFLQENGFQIDYAPFFTERIWFILYEKGHYFRKTFYILLSFFNRFILLFSIKKFDYVFIHREMAPLGPPVFEFILSKIIHKRFIYDFDDAIWLPNFSQANASFEKLKMYTKVNKIMKWADRISAGNDYLAQHAKKFNQNVCVIPTTIDTIHYHNISCDQQKEPITIGWTGSHSTMRYLDTIIPILRDLEQEYLFKFRIISDKKPSFNLHSMEFVKWQKDSEIKDLAQIQIGLMPLVEDKWAAGKCGFKGLQYMSLGIVAVMSPIGVNRQIVKDGINGFLVESENDWKEVLIKLMSNPSLRKEIGLKGKQTIFDHYSVRSQQENYLHLFDK